MEVVKFGERSEFFEASAVDEAGWQAGRRCCNAQIGVLDSHPYALWARIKLARYL